MIRTALVLTLLLAGASLPAQQPLTIAGRVLAAADGAPLRRARIDVSAGNQRLGAVFTDDQGRFALDVSGGGPFIVTVAKGGYAFARTARSRADAETPLTVRLTRSAAIAGHAAVAGGSPAVGSTITARRLDPETPGVPQAFSTTTDDLGAYRLGGLPAGRFELSAGPAQPSVVMTATAAEFMVQSGLLVNDSARLQRDRFSGATVIDPAPTAERRAVIVTTGDGTTSTLPLRPPAPTLTVVVGAGEEVGGIDFVVPPVQTVEEMMRAQGLKISTPERVNLPGQVGVIAGRITDASGQAIRDARVQVTGITTQGSTPATSLQQVWTDADGRYAVRGLRAGSYTIRVSRLGDALASGQERAGEAGRTIALSTDQIADDLDIVLPRAVAITGMVLDDHGEPLQGAAVQVAQLRQMNGRLTAVPMSVTRRTDDGGRYRLFTLLPGTYVVSASVEGVVSGPETSRGTGYASVFYPGTPLIDAATPIALTADTDSVNLVWTRTRAARVRGLALDGDVPLIGGTARLLVSRRSNAIAFELPPATIRSDGRFTFENVPPGEYVVQVRGDGPGRTGLFGVEPVSVADAEPGIVNVRTAHGTTIEGRFVIEGEAVAACRVAPAFGALVIPCDARPPSAFTIVPVALDPDRARPENTSSFVVSSQGTFYLSGLFGPTAFALRRAPSDTWFLKAVTIGGVDVTDAAFEAPVGPHTIGDAEIVVSNNGATITGRATERDAPVEDYAVVAFPIARDQWTPHSRRLRFARSSRGGAFRLTGLPPGDYYVAAVDRLDGSADGGEWQTADVLNRLVPGAERITLIEGESRAATLRLTRR